MCAGIVKNVTEYAVTVGETVRNRVQDTVRHTTHTHNTHTHTAHTHTHTHRPHTLAAADVVCLRVPGGAGEVREGETEVEGCSCPSLGGVPGGGTNEGSDTGALCRQSQCLAQPSARSTIPFRFRQVVPCRHGDAEGGQPTPETEIRPCP